jgi:phi13 family phage major tail protein
MPTVTGIEKLYVAKLLTDTLSAINYATPKYYEGVQEFDMKPKQNTEKQYAENKVRDQASSLDSVDVDLTLAALTSAQKAEILGQSIAAEGGVYAAQEDEAPYVAVLYKATIKGGYRYGVIYKGMFTLPEDSLKTQEGKPQFISPKISAAFQPTIYQITGQDEKKKSLWEWHVDTTDPNCPDDIGGTWFNSVKFPTADTAALTVTTVPLNNATGVLGTASTVFTFSKAVLAETIIDSNVFLLKAGIPVDTALTIDPTGKIVTLKPTANMATGIYTAICSKNVKSAAGVPLAATVTTNFTV